jgi:hypothetical protein
MTDTRIHQIISVELLRMTDPSRVHSLTVSVAAVATWTVSNRVFTLVLNLINRSVLKSNLPRLGASVLVCLGQNLS